MVFSHPVNIAKQPNIILSDGKELAWVGQEIFQGENKCDAISLNTFQISVRYWLLSRYWLNDNQRVLRSQTLRRSFLTISARAGLSCLWICKTMQPICFDNFKIVVTWRILLETLCHKNTWPQPHFIHHPIQKESDLHRDLNALHNTKIITISLLRSSGWSALSCSH